MATKIITKNSSTASAVPLAADLVQGELAVNVTDKKLYTKNNAGSVVSIGDTPSIIDNGNATAITIDSNENVGIGTSSPGYKLDVSGTANINSSLSIAGPCGVIYGDTGNSLVIAADNGALGANSTMQFRVDGTERARIDTSGNFLVGVTSTLNDGKITVRTPTSFAGANFRSDSQTGAGTGWNHFYGTSSSNSVANIIIRGNGNLENANNSYGGVSDEKLKENITETSPKLTKLNKVRIVNYNFIGDEQKQLGVIAQELEKIFPGMVEETEDRDEEGNATGTTTKSVKYSVFVPILIKAVQEQQVLIEAQSTQSSEQAAVINNLTERLAALEAK